MSIYHDVTDFVHRSPLGAIRCGETVRISLNAPEADASGGELVVFGQDYSCRAALSRDGNRLLADFTAPETPEVLWYHFLLHGFPYDFYCGAAENGLDSEIVNEWPRSFQLTVFARDFETPAWFRRSVMYQIFPDRFSRDDSGAANKGLEYHRSLGRRVRYHEGWDEPVCWAPEPGEQSYSPNDFYGGTLNGITQKLPYLKNLGVGVIYLNPIFEADSNHRYNTADYKRVDPVLGSEADFRGLCEKARELGIRIMLDGVFSHTGSDSVYFNREGRYEAPGAYQGAASAYYEWFDFSRFPDIYRSWWGFPSLPEVNEAVPGWQREIYSGKDAVVPYWLRAGASGWRLDVADELPDEVLAGIYSSAKQEDPGSVVLGEVWEDPTTKESYGKKRRYALGGMLDTVMNYPLRNGITGFATGKITAGKLCELLLNQRLNYPGPMYYALMNLLSSHDVPRLRTVLGTDVYALHDDKAKQAALKLTPEENQRAVRLQKLCAVLQFCLPGVPCIYYGDEQGMQGAFDPFDRAAFVESEPEMMAFYAELSARRNGSEALKSGGVGFCPLSDDVVCVVRVSEGGSILTAVNRGEREFRLELTFFEAFRGLSEAERRLLSGKRLKAMIAPLGWVYYEF